MNFIDDMKKKVESVLPDNVDGFVTSLRTSGRQILDSSLSHFNITTREEFESQKMVLQKTRQKIEDLEKQVEILLNQQSK